MWTDKTAVHTSVSTFNNTLDRTTAFNSASGHDSLVVKHVVVQHQFVDHFIGELVSELTHDDEL